MENSGLLRKKPLSHAISTRLISFNQKIRYHNLIEGNKETVTQRSRFSPGSKSFLGRDAGRNTNTFKPSEKNVLLLPSTEVSHRDMGEFIHLPESLIYCWEDDL